MKCPNCGAEVKEGKKYCMACGELIQSDKPESASSDQRHAHRNLNQTGNLIVEMKASQSDKVKSCIGLAACGVILLIFLGWYYDQEFGYHVWYYLAPSRAWIFWLCMALFITVFGPYCMYKLNQSFCNVYDFYVSGKTTGILGIWQVQDFKIGYDEIINITESKGSITIYTSYTKYTVLAYDNNSQQMMVKTSVVRTIRNKMSGNANPYGTGR